MTKLIIKRVSLGARVIKTTRKFLHYLGYKSDWLEGAELVGYWKKADSFIIKHPTKEIYWCVSRSSIKELSKFNP